GKTYGMSFHRGEPGEFSDSGERRPDAPFAPFENNSVLNVLGKAKKGVTGTRVRYWADRQIFTKDAAFQYDELVTRARQTAFLVPGLELVVRDERFASDPEIGVRETSYRYEGGLGEFVEFLSTDSPVTDTWRLDGSGT